VGQDSNEKVFDVLHLSSILHAALGGFGSVQPYCQHRFTDFLRKLVVSETPSKPSISLFLSLSPHLSFSLNIYGELVVHSMMEQSCDGTLFGNLEFAYSLSVRHHPLVSYRVIG